MKSFATVAFLSLIVIGCDSNEAELGQAPRDLKPALFEEEDSKREYFYNNANQLTQIKLTSTFPNGGTLTSVQNFSYLSNGKLAETTSDTGFRFVYTYTGDKISRTDDYTNGIWSQYHSFSYDVNGRLMESVTYQDIPEEGGIIPTSKDTYQYDVHGNLEVMEMYYYTAAGAEAHLLSTFISSDYDNKLNTEDFFDVNVFNPYITLRKNNPGKLITQNASGSTITTERFSYQYHPQGYATSKTTHVTWYHGGTGTYTSKYAFRE